MADGNTAPRGPSAFGGVPGMTGFTEEPSPGGAVSEVFHEAEVADRVELHFKNELRVAGIEGEWHVVPDGGSTELIELAKSVDMAIMGQRAPRADGAARIRPDDIVMAVGRPVLVVLNLALADYDAALQANPKNAFSLYGRGVAKRLQGDATGADADIAAAEQTSPDIAEDFERYGVPAP